MLWIVDGNFWLLLLLLLLEPPFGTSRQFLIVVGNTKRPAFRIWNGHFVSDGAGLFGALAPILRIIDRDFGHGSAPRTDHGDDSDCASDALGYCRGVPW